jgi:hypothetical protein
LPARFAATVQVPTPTNVATEPLTVHTEGVSELKVGASPEEAVAAIVYVPPKTGLAGATDVKVTVCAAFPTVISCVTRGAAL